MDSKRARRGNAAGLVCMCFLSRGNLFVRAALQEARADMHKWQYAQDAQSGADPWDRKLTLEPSIVEAACCRAVAAARVYPFVW